MRHNLGLIVTMWNRHVSGLRAEWRHGCSTWAEGEPARTMKCLEKQIAKIEKSHWILLTRDFWGDWTFSIWGTYPLSRSLGLISERDAKKQAFFAAKQHLVTYGLQIEADDVSELCWSVAIRQMVA